MLRTLLFRNGLLCFVVCVAGCHTTRMVAPDDAGHRPNLCIRAVTTKQGDVVKFSADPRRPCAEIEDGKIVGRLRDGTRYEILLSDVEEVHVLPRDMLERERKIGLGVGYLLVVTTVVIAIAVWHGVTSGGLS